MQKFLVLVLVMFFAGTTVLGQVRNSLVRNGSFEYDGASIDYITADDAPRYWCDVNLVEDKFGASLWSGGLTEGNYYLRVYCTDYGEFNQGDMGLISQEVYLDDANEIIFDLQLSTPYGDEWDPLKRSAVVAIDGNVVWESNSVGTDVRGLYEGQVCTIPQGYKNGQTHIVSVGIRINSGTDGFPIEYDSEWDFVKFDVHCGGFGHLAADLNQDCYVTLADLAVLGLSWMSEPASAKDDLYEDGIVDNLDLALFAEDWLFNTDWTRWGQARTVRMEKLALDLDLSGEIDAGDLMILSEFWLGDGTCAQIELSGDDVVNFKDFASFASEWGLRDWLYYVE